MDGSEMDSEFRNIKWAYFDQNKIFEDAALAYLEESAIDIKKIFWRHFVYI